MPGLVNAHTHLELSYLRDEIPPASRFIDWIRAVIAARRERPDPEAPEILDAVDRAIADAIACGTAVLGDISNTLVTIPRLVQSPLAAVVFYELIRFNVPTAADAERLVEKALADLDSRRPDGHVRASLAAHAPYSVSARLFNEIKRAVDRNPHAPYSVHLAESAEEVEFVERGIGPWRTLLEELGAWDRDWAPPKVSPVQYLDHAGFIDRNLLAVHGVQMRAADLSTIAARGATLVTCPRSNARTGAGSPPIADFYAAGVGVAVGTDSLASTPDLNVFAELVTMRTLAPKVPAASLLDSATRQGARALGFDADYGTITPGKRARLVAVAIPRATRDVEEYLVGGIDPSEIRWIDELR
jgi:cytosine/adenosine deaminase-related metal-dependent hydrolase